MEKDSEYKMEFISFDVHKVLFDRKTNDKEYDFKVSVKQAVADIQDKPGVFKSSFLLSIEGTSDDKPISIKVEASGIFKIHNAPPHDIIENFKHISAPSIVYPYLRSFLSLLTLNAGLNPVILPAINFLQQYKQKRSE